MIIRNGVRGTMNNVPEVEINFNTVYVRTNIVRIEEAEFNGWQYDETEYTQSEYIDILEVTLKNANSEIALLRKADLDNKMALTEIFEMLIM
jgi:hypothetical protein